MLSNASMQHKKQSATCLGSALTGAPLGTSDSPLDYLDRRSTEVPIPLYSRKLYTRSPFVSRRSRLPEDRGCQVAEVAAAYETLRRPRSRFRWVLLRNSVVIDVHSERNRTNHLTVSFRSPRQLLPSILLRFRCYNIYLDRVGIMRG